MASNKTVYNFSHEPAGYEYHQLIDVGMTCCDKILLVIRNTVDVGDNAKQNVNLLKPFLLDSKKSSQWPGTVLLDGKTAMVNRYRLTAEVVNLIKQSAKGLYSWKQPFLPEDLCLLRPDGSVWLTSISHEKDGCLELTFEEKKQLSDEIPGLQLYELKGSE